MTLLDAITGHSVEVIFKLDQLEIFTMSPLAPEAPTGPYKVEKGERERINESHADTFCGRPAVAYGKGG